MLVSPAAGDLTRAITQLSQPKPAYYLERAQALADEGEERIDDALCGLDAGIKTLGSVVTLQLCAIDLELQKNHYDGALTRLEQIVAHALPKDQSDGGIGNTLVRHARAVEYKTE